jgi:hypothetical protein
MCTLGSMHCSLGGSTGWRYFKDEVIARLAARLGLVYTNLFGFV